MEVKKIVDLQREFYYSNKTINIDFRKENLLKLKNAILKYEDQLKEALFKDLGKNASESYFAEIGITLREISYMMKHLKRLTRNRPVRTSLTDFPAKSFRSPHPYGVVLVMSPWNYPVMLTLCPLVGAIAAGNTCVVKPSEYSINTSDVLNNMISEVFPAEYVACVTGGVETSQEVLNQKFDYIFFTGGKHVGKIVMQKAATNLTPVSLELGGKSPCIIDESANLKVSAKRIAFGKYLNAGQTCVAPDYLYIHESIKQEFLEYLIQNIENTFGKTPLESEHLGKIINQKHYNRLKELLKDQEITYGGSLNDEKLKISPTVLDNISQDNKIMEDEIFGPILPILTFKEIDEVIHYVNSQPNPLALYLFTKNTSIETKILKSCNFGGGCINDTIMHVASDSLPFGGVGESGMGSYHGKASFETFSHYRSILKKETWLDIPARYAPYSKLKETIIKLFLR
jgi:aldehyde dehydrogenase (NAD+)